jgi:hypothetical protein
MLSECGGTDNSNKVDIYKVVGQNDVGVERILRGVTVNGWCPILRGEVST